MNEGYRKKVATKIAKVELRLYPLTKIIYHYGRLTTNI
jgi:hypothetical protein